MESDNLGMGISLDQFRSSEGDSTNLLVFRVLLCVGNRTQTTHAAWRGIPGSGSGRETFAVFRARWYPTLGANYLIAFLLSRILDLNTKIIGSVIPICSTIFTIGYLLYLHSSEERPWVLIASLLFIFMGACLVLGSSAVRADTEMVVYFVTYGFQVGWMGVILLSPLQELTRRLAFVVLGVLTLIALSEISKLNLDQYLHPATVSESSSPTHNVHAAA